MPTILPMKFAILPAIMLVVSVVAPSAAQDNDEDSRRYTILGQVRHRFESSARSLNSSVDPINFNLLRTRLGVHFFVEEGVEAVLQIQDSRVMGEEKSTLTDGSADRLDMQQGYLKITEIFDWPLDVQLGRFQANYGSQRLIGSVEWHNIGRTFDGVRFTLRPKHVSIDLYNLQIVEELEPGGEGDLNLIGVNGDFELFKNYKTQGYVIWQKGIPSSKLSRYTVGIFFSGATAGFKSEVELAYQGGEFEERDVSAYMATLNAGYTFQSSSIQPSISAGIDYLSGDDDPGDGKHKVFDTLYATNHKFYGYMDYFLNIPVHTLGSGLSDIHVKVAIKPSPDASLRLAYHTFLANEDYTLSDGSTSTRFGTELDLTFVFNYTDRVKFVAGVSAFSPGAIFKETRGEDTGTWGYVMTSVNL